MIAEDAQGALTKFFDAVEKIQGQDRAGVLVDIFGKNYSSTVATLVGSIEKFVLNHTMFNYYSIAISNSNKQHKT